MQQLGALLKETLSETASSYIEAENVTALES